MDMKQTYEYKRVGNCSIKADVYPTTIPKSPAIIFIHGGALIWGSKDSMIPEQIQLYNQAGYTVVSIDYRLAPETKLEQIREDITDALNWVKIQGKDLLKIDPERIALVGSSAGGYLSLLAGAFPEKPQAIVSFYGYGDILADWYGKPSEFYSQQPHVLEEEAYSFVSNQAITQGNRERFQFYLYCRQQGIWTNLISGYDFKIDKQLLQQFCPVYNINKSYPPTLLIHGDMDTDVPYEQSVQMFQELTNQGVYAELITVSGAGHAFDYDMTKSETKDVFKRALSFLDNFV